MRTLHEILLDQKEAATILEQDFDAIELREILTNPATYETLGEEL